eukprot:6362725-Amphidinium_carterae.1
MKTLVRTLRNLSARVAPGIVSQSQTCRRSICHGSPPSACQCSAHTTHSSPYLRLIIDSERRICCPKSKCRKDSAIASCFHTECRDTSFTQTSFGDSSADTNPSQAINHSSTQKALEMQCLCYHSHPLNSQMKTL